MPPRTELLTDILNDNHNSHARTVVYIVRDNDFVIYVGKTTTGVSTRLQSHCGCGEWGWSGEDSLGCFIRENKPDSDNWKVDIYTVDDCISELRSEKPYYKFFDIDDAEQYFIHLHNPALNIVHNATPIKIPNGYVGNEIIISWAGEEESL